VLFRSLLRNFFISRLLQSCRFLIAVNMAKDAPQAGRAEWGEVTGPRVELLEQPNQQTKGASMKTWTRGRQWQMGAVVVMCAVGNIASAVPISLDTPTGTYTQNFDSLAASGSNISWVNGVTLSGWYLFNRNGLPITTYVAGNGSSSTGSFYSFGTDSSDRALGSVGSGATYFGSPGPGSVAGWIALALTNRSGATLDEFSVEWAGEQWRNSGNADSQTMVFEYGFGASFSTVSTWIAPGGNFNWVSPLTGGSAGQVDGNGGGKVSEVGGSIDGLNWLADETLWLRWVELNDPGSDHGLAIDDFSFAWRASLPPDGTTSVPDAGSSLALFGLALGGLGWLGRRFVR
jgi:uncharacterized protein